MSAARVGELRAVEKTRLYFRPSLARRSIVGVGITPPKVLGTPKPASSVMMSSTFGAPLGGTTRGAHQYLEFSASCLITPPNFGSGGGNCFPLIVVVAPGEPGVPVTCWACAVAAVAQTADRATPSVLFTAFRFMILLLSD